MAPSLAKRYKFHDQVLRELPPPSAPLITDRPEFGAVKEEIRRLPPSPAKGSTKKQKLWGGAKWGLRHVVGIPIP
ncbi:MAG: hypothetical protein HY551_06485 [Elusimicrobia bacterium]|nr:hypothetical protein [Elusimicrobiota bacterium]